MTSAKPLFTFFKMLGCGHCVQFANSPTPETSPWAQLLRDADLQAKVTFVMREWGTTQNEAGQMVRTKLPAEYSFVNYGPYFYLEAFGNPSNGFEFKADNEHPRNATGMKKWILKMLASNASLTSKVQSVTPKKITTTTRVEAPVKPFAVPPDMVQKIESLTHKVESSQILGRPTQPSEAPMVEAPRVTSPPVKKPRFIARNARRK